MQALSNLENLISSDFNYSYTINGFGVFQIYKRSIKDPFRMTPILQLGMVTNLPFIKADELVREVCESLAKKEYEYRKLHPIVDEDDLNDHTKNQGEF